MRVGPVGSPYAIPLAGADAEAALRSRLNELETRLQESEARLRAMSDAMPQMVWSADAAGDADYYNERWCEFSGLSPAQLMSGTWLDLVHAQDRDQAAALWRRSVETGEPFEVECRLRDRHGAFRWSLARALPIRTAAGMVTHWWGTCTDIHEQRLAQQALQDARLRLEGTLSVTEIGTWVFDIPADRVYADANMAGLYGVSEADAHGGPSRAYFANVHPDDVRRVRAIVEESLRTGAAYKDEYRVHRREGGWRQIHARGKVEFDADGRPAWLPGIALDVTQQRLAEEVLRQMDRRKDEFLATLAHELRNPLAPISTSASALPRVKNDPAKVEKFADIIARQARHVSALVEDLLDVSRVSRGLVTLHKAEVDVGDVVRDALEQVQPAAARKHHRLACSGLPEPLFVLGDEKRLVQVLVNLLQNAVKFTPPGGSIALAVAADARQVRIAVRDTGVGMDEDLLQGAFELFRQGARSSDRAEGGLGIGLALVKNLVALHGGSAAARSAGPGLGSEFEIVLPRAGAQAAG